MRVAGGDGGGVEGGGGFFPLRSLVGNLERYARFATAAYDVESIQITATLFPKGRDLMILLGVGKIRDIHSTDPHIHVNHYSFAIHTTIPVNDILHSSYDTNRDPPPPSSPTMQPLNHYVVLDRAARVVVVALRGTLGLSDVLTDMRFDYAEFRGGRVHAGMGRSAALKFRRGTEVFCAVERALRENPGFGLVLTGHSLGGGVAALMAMEWSCPVDPALARTSRTPFVTSLSSGLPPGRPIHCYSYGSPCVASYDLSTSTKGLISTLVNGDDIVPTMSLGLVRDFKIVTMHLLDPTNKGLSERIISKTLGIRGAAGGNVGEEEEEFFWTIISRLRVSMKSERLYPSGVVYWVSAGAVTEVLESGGRREMRRVMLQRCDDVREMFAEPVFSSRVMSDHTPKAYEDAVEALGRAVGGGGGVGGGSSNASSGTSGRGLSEFSG
ncbi:hypothetical protein HDU67_006844 [Dinochytrium kinnereticum]|nr:hypothetical protein HDU67_006844 [Dinochytrium kinnereticum]